jgi:RNA polymerase sigma factor (sigma-70 family)
MDPPKKQALFEQSVMPHLNAAHNLARWLTRNAHDAEDVVQEAYLRAFRSFETFEGQDSKAWLLAVVRNTCFTWLKKKGGKPVVEFDERMHSSDDSPNAESFLLNQSALGSLNDCLEALPVEFREAIVLRELEELSYKEISDIARVPIGTVMSRLARGRKRLQECLGGSLK